MANKGFFSGRIAQAPVLRMGDTEVCTFTLIRNEYAGKDKDSGEAKERIASVQFTAFNGRGRALAENAAVGDQIEVEYRIANNNYEKDGETIYGFNFVVDSWEFGAPGALTRDRLAAAQSAMQNKR
jgi:single-strand DNA-binding protein